MEGKYACDVYTVSLIDAHSCGTIHALDLGRTYMVEQSV